MARSYAKFKGRLTEGTFMRVPTAVLESENFCSLSNKSKALLLDIGARFNGHNNGDLAAPWSWMRRRGWRSKDTLQRALTELRQFGMIELTRQGGLHGPNLYAFTWLPIEACKGKLEIGPTNKASGKWKEAPALVNNFPPRSLGKATPTIGLVETTAVH